MELNDFVFHIVKHHIDETEMEAYFLELTIEEAIVDTATLRNLYNAFYSVLLAIDE